MNRRVKVTWIMLHTIAHSLMVHARVSEYYINFCVKVYGISYIPGTTNQILDKQRHQADHTI